MNDYHSNLKWVYKKRWLGKAVKNALKNFPVAVLSGARQVGKSTFLQNEFKKYKYLNLDDFSILAQAQTDPSSLWIGSEHKGIIIDEAQKAPKIFSAIKQEVDKKRSKTKFIISGSSNLLLLEKITESLAGRAIYFEMFPMTLGEVKGKSTPQNFFKLFEAELRTKEKELEYISPLPYMLRGFMPRLMYIEDRNNILTWWESYIKTYLERDLRELSQIDSLIDFRRVVEAVAFRTGNILNQTQIAKDTGVSQPTVYRYIKLLEVSNIIVRVPAYYKNRRKRLLKTPKVFFIDPALSIYLSGYYDEEYLARAREIGYFFETLVFLHLKVLSEITVPKVKLFYWRATSGEEVDFVLEQGKKLIALEVKLTKNPGFNDIKNLLSFIKEYPETHIGILIHSGSSIKWLHSKIIAVPWWWIAV